MIYRILTDDPYKHDDGDRWRAGLSGAANCLSGIMWELDLPAPSIHNERARFYFTERGWQDYGKAIAAEGIRRGHIVKVIRRKEPRASQIVYRDAMQLAILPEKRSGRL
jgi:hypothetical protein